MGCTVSFDRDMVNEMSDVSQRGGYDDDDLDSSRYDDNDRHTKNIVPAAEEEAKQAGQNQRPNGISTNTTHQV
eukprot:CAMPEP_0185025808 /NCGR_PEP_ID=MMETSP1103-20130426/9389_1 /TAXON_ID=36769 /ORGANISM="Paraphysomonas bandaiensis, Strain Caron Lab Isolate" /LENGTH=72 /DNA_ID=CAMNT_0027559169 /DNA_START=47 /DNA_END=265 /DNA_ORIENTATION=+